ncbi:hypothetical protein AAFF_G00095750 [Aldrovandia affinis]|uniref:Uncharacterized protein n=1 Tax=Aldrovandia affinis TaxID=143900 RepID=A0AAD7RY52_9TELE|nr:hypothetical protein AAFF_G00095750 [Aldrovandia affinis]
MCSPSLTFPVVGLSVCPTLHSAPTTSLYFQPRKRAGSKQLSYGSSTTQSSGDRRALTPRLAFVSRRRPACSSELPPPLVSPPRCAKRMRLANAHTRQPVAYSPAGSSICRPGLNPGGPAWAFPRSVQSQMWDLPQRLATGSPANQEMEPVGY